MNVAGPFYLAMVAKTETTFGPSHLRMDEFVVSARRVLAEGEPPKLELVIANPRVGLLAMTRKQHCWFAWDSNWGGTPNVIPLFFGRITGIPSDLQAETITVTFVAKPSNYKRQLQLVAEALKVPPFYDQVFTDISRRDDPMAIFESQSKLVCVNPVTNVVSASDILDAEDGNVDFTQDDHFYESMHSSPGAVPKTAIHVDAVVPWTQTARGYVDMGNRTFVSYTGDGLLSEWPKPLSQIAQGLSVFSSLAVDGTNTGNIVTSTLTGNYTNMNKEHADGDALTATWSWTTPQIHGAFDEKQLTFAQVIGVQDPLTVDENGDPAPTNIPASVNETKAYVPIWTIRTSMVLEYRAERPHTERVIFTLFADVQSTTLDPLVSEDSETISISGSDVGRPLVNLLNWTTVSGQHVDPGTVIFPNDPLFPGDGTAQICVVAGTTGLVEPEFSDVPGETTVDGGVTWASLGVTTPSDNAPDWTKDSNVPVGQLILPRRPLTVTRAAFMAAGKLQFPPIDTSITEGTILQEADGTYVVAANSGLIGSTATLVPLASIPTGTTYFIAITGGTTGDTLPPFNETLYATTADGTVVWAAVGHGEIPAGGTPGNVTASTYFGSDRGRLISIPHLICRARARLRYASRCVSTQFQCSYLRGTELTLRKSATLHDYRLPGGLLVGKVTSTDLVASNGSFTCNVTVASSVGHALAVEEVPGDPSYVDADYVEEYQVYDGQIVLLPDIEDVGYSPLVPVADEDGISFPLQKSMFVVSEDFVDLGQKKAVSDGLIAMAKAAVQQATPTNNTLIADEQKQRDIALLQSNSVAEQLRRHPAFLDLELKPINGNGSFNHVYHLKCTTLQLPKMTDLEEESTA